MTDRLAEIEARRKAATPGPWDATRSDPAEGVDCWWITAGGGNQETDIGTVSGGKAYGHSAGNADLVAHSPEDIKWLEEEVKRLRAEVSSMEDAKEEMMAHYERRIPYD